MSAPAAGSAASTPRTTIERNESVMCSPPPYGATLCPHRDLYQREEARVHVFLPRNGSGRSSDHWIRRFRGFRESIADPSAPRPSKRGRPRTVRRIKHRVREPEGLPIVASDRTVDEERAYPSLAGQFVGPLPKRREAIAMVASSLPRSQLSAVAALVAVLASA